MFFFFRQKTAYEMRISDWSSDVCSSDLKAEQVVASRAVDLNGMRVIPLEAAIEEGLLYLIPEPRSPHGVDVSPNGKYMTVAGKLDPHVTEIGRATCRKRGCQYG